MGKYVIKQAKTGFHFNLKAGNGEVIATSEIYKSEKSCLSGVEGVRKNAPIAALEDQTVQGFVAEENPKFEIYLDKAKEFRFRLRGEGGDRLLGSEGYKSKAGCKNGIESVRKNAASEVVSL